MGMKIMLIETARKNRLKALASLKDRDVFMDLPGHRRSRASKMPVFFSNRGHIGIVHMGTC